VRGTFYISVKQLSASKRPFTFPEFSASGCVFCIPFDHTSLLSTRQSLRCAYFLVRPVFIENERCLHTATVKIIWNFATTTVSSNICLARRQKNDIFIRDPNVFLRVL
jgi:hypothetical protein